MRLTAAPLTLTLVVVNILLYAIDFFTGGRLANAYALQPLAIEQGEWWRAITAGFMHASWAHVLINMYALVQAGMFVEYVYGTARYAIIYFLALLGGSALAYATTMHTPVETLGASGAIMGVFGAMAVLGFKLPRLRGELLRAALLPIVLTLGWGLLNPYISNAGHIGGLIGGVIAAAILTPVRGQRLAPAQAEQEAPPDQVEPGQT